MTDDENNPEEEKLAQTVEESVREDLEKEESPKGIPNEVFVIPLTRRPFFPGMAEIGRAHV